MESEAVASAQAYIDAPWVDDGPVGLLLPATPDPRLSIARRGNLLQLHGTTQGGEQRGGGKRGQVRGLSRQARGRLMRFVASIDRTYPVSNWRFITMTYPAEFPHDPLIYHKHFDTWSKRFRRAYPEAAAIWKCEYQSRGAAHFHVLCFSGQWVDYRWLSQSWADVVDSGDPAHLRAGTQIKAVRSWNGVAFYAAKYIGKRETLTDDASTGRCWGIINRAALPVEVNTVPLLFAEFYVLRRLMRRFARQVKPQPWCPAPAGARKAFPLRPRGSGQGATLFVAERVAVRLLRGLAGGWQIDAEQPPARHKSSFVHWADQVSARSRFAA